MGTARACEWRTDVRLSKSTAVVGCGIAVLMLWVTTAEAQRRAVPRGGGGRSARASAPRSPGVRSAGRGYRGRPVYRGVRGYRGYRPYYGGYSPYYYGFYNPYVYGPPYGYGYGYRYPYYGAQYLRGSVRLEVKPRETEVFVDGYYAGVVDSYDGFFQRLHLPPGEHELELYLGGHESIRESFYLIEGETYKLQHEMVPLAPGAPQPPRPEPPEQLEPDPDVDYNLRVDPGQRRRAPEPPLDPAGPFGRGGLPSASPPAPSDPVGVDHFGSLAIRVQPRDAEILIDGEAWEGFAGLDRFEVELGAGPHVVEVRRDGYRPYRTEVDVREGDTTRLNVSLPRIGGDDQ